MFYIEQTISKPVLTSALPSSSAFVRDVLVHLYPDDFERHRQQHLSDVQALIQGILDREEYAFSHSGTSTAHLRM